MLERIKLEPDTYDQSSWLCKRDQDELDKLDTIFDITKMLRTQGADLQSWASCGTTACVAGHAIFAAMELSEDLRDLVSSYDNRSQAVYIESAAKAMLDLFDHWLFYPERTLDQVHHTLGRIAKGKEEF